MKKKTLFLIILGLLIVVLAGGVFWWWQDQSEVKELNKKLPKGVRVVKSLFGKEYKVINEIDGYELEIPKEWGGIEGIEYSTFEKEEEIKSFLFLVASKKGEGFAGIELYRETSVDKNLELWAKKWAEEHEPFLITQIKREMVKIEKEKLGNLEAVEFKTKTGSVLSYFFQKNSKIYRLWGGAPDKSIREIILNGKW